MAEAKKPVKKAAVKRNAATPKATKTKVAPRVAPAKKTQQPTLNIDTTEEKDDNLISSASEDKPIAKAGRRSAKALAEAEAKQAKEERKAEAREDKPAEKPAKSTTAPVRSRSVRRSKAYRKAAELIERDKQYSLSDALALAIKTSTIKFDATVELHINLGVDPKQADQNIRQTVVLPAGTGKTSRVAVYADVDDVAKAKKAGADIALGDEFLQQLDKGEVAFDTLIATPAMMPKLGKYARLLGPKGLMPNPKSGTVTTNVAKAVTEAKAGRVEYRVDPTGIIHVAVGKVSFDADKLTKNAQAVLSSIKAAKPASLKGIYVKSVFVTTTMGPSVPVQTSEL